MKTFHFPICILVLSLLFAGCKKDSSSPAATTGVATIITTAVTNITNTTASSGGSITNDGGAPIVDRGVCWSTSTAPLVTGNHISDGTGTASFTSNITGLTANTNYYVRAYAVNNNGTAYGNEISFTTTNIPDDVYAVGEEYTGIGNMRYAKLWKNGVGTNLTNGNELANANSVFVSGNDVYVGGEEYNSNQSSFDAKIWKNGVATILNTPNSNSNECNSIYVSGSDVYAGGQTRIYPGLPLVKMWKNGVASTLYTNSGTVSGSRVSSIFVSGSDVYVAGSIYLASTGFYEGAIWKNGVLTILPGSPIGHTKIYSIFVSGNDVYAAGEQANTAIVWKNANRILQFNSCVAKSVYVSGTDVYVSGIKNGFISSGLYDAAIFWKNGVLAYLTDATKNAAANAIFVRGNNVYAAGYESNGIKNVAKIWKNGVATSITNGTQDASIKSIFVR